MPEVGARYIRTAEVSGLLDVPEWTLLDWVRRGLVPRGVACRIGQAYRWDRQRLEDWLATGGNMPPAGATEQTPAPAAKSRRGRPRRTVGGGAS